jgi:hypothetical protein
VPAETPGQRIMAELRADPARSDRAIARAASSDHRYVARIRRRLVSYRVIPPPPPTAAQRAAAALRTDPHRSDRLIASETATDPSTVRRTRSRLEASRDIPAVPVRDREQRYPNGPRSPGKRPALEAAARYPKAAPAELAARFGLPYSSAHWALREVARRRPAPAAHADQGQVSLPPPPDWSRGLCTTLPRHQRSWWTSDDLTERQAAARYCQDCPVLGPCEAWCLALPWSDRSAVYAGMLPGARQKRKREIRAEITRQVLQGVRWP